MFDKILRKKIKQDDPVHVKIKGKLTEEEVGNAENLSKEIRLVLQEMGITEFVCLAVNAKDRRVVASVQIGSEENAFVAVESMVQIAQTLGEEFFETGKDK